MKKKNLILTAALVASLAAVSPVAFPQSTALCAPVAAQPVEGYAPEGQVMYQNSGMRLCIPKEYDGLLLTETPRKTGDGKLFSISEKASMEAAKIGGYSEEGAGWLFTVGWADEARFREMLCRDMTGVEVFARDNLGNRYLFYHPTDVRYFRKDIEAMRRDEQLWTKLNEWAHRDVCGSFILDNLDRGLTAETYDNSTVAMHLARTAYETGVKYTIGTTQFGPLSPGSVEAAPYAEHLIRNATYKMTDKSEIPDGEYVVLNFPDEKIRFDFFKLTGFENYVREVHEDGTEILFKVTYKDGMTKAGAVMQRWYSALAAAR